MPSSLVPKLPVPEAFEEACPGTGDEVRKVLGVPNALAAFRSSGSTAPAEVERQLRGWQERLS